ncbi:patatin-like phospholipase RssA [Alloalcanivorax xenomutans]|uniref:Patatin-like phospholipase RssA n=1 Tax=Alloalcanivorax xenomutans TaxID=1094342 RepID=A0A9Q3W5I8_9GAMM|nr:patatin-like phospholipase RssA [Alloalcanivorax xenomutans]MBA4723187.1 patatin-like phospholipase RssA [Alcanivorax sp.]ARB45126.1 patatin [Alloalcanivorax xenomutans]MCE7509140.1 patatin-like phospholipase RssA [Alloalcanivorax xenomutans]MCE7522455.1 patatin-like phospholipase RssA [Alloalcanivorax xenomutans]PHS63415.1 MAG: patatin [Alcanivorax sp.]
MSTEGEQDTPPAPRLGLALGSGSARGWAHIGVIQALEEMGVRPDVVAGTSIGALVGSAYVNGALDDLADWVKTLTTKDVFGLMDFTLSGGVVKGEKLFGFFEERHSNPNIEDLEQRFVTVATDMKSGREIWISKGPILQAARASCALPGLFTPLKHQGRWMLDGGLVNPVPVSAARAFGADVVIAVNLNAQLVGAHLSRQKPPGENGATEEEHSLWQKMANYFTSGDGQAPGFFDVIASSVNIMQDRITRSRMAGDPPEITLIPLLEDFALMDFHRAKEAIDEGRRLVERHAGDIRAWLGKTGNSE